MRLSWACVLRIIVPSLSAPDHQLAYGCEAHFQTRLDFRNLTDCALPNTARPAATDGLGRDDLDLLNRTNNSCSFPGKSPLQDQTTRIHLATWTLLLLLSGQNKELGIHASLAAVDGEGVHCEMT